MYRVEVTANFKKDIRSLERGLSTRILNKIEWLARHPEAIRYPLKYLPQDLEGLHKYRIGDYRLLFWVDHDSKVLTLYGIKHRRSVYDKF